MLHSTIIITKLSNGDDGGFPNGGDDGFLNDGGGFPSGGDGGHLAAAAAAVGGDANGARCDDDDELPPAAADPAAAAFADPVVLPLYINAILFFL